MRRARDHVFRLVCLGFTLCLASMSEANEDSNQEAFSLLHEAVRNGWLDEAKVLLSKGADLNGQVKIRGVLDPNYDFLDDTPTDLALAFGHDELYAFLRKNGGKTSAEIEADRRKIISWGKQVDGLQLGVALAIEKDKTKLCPTYLNVYFRNTRSKSLTISFLVLANSRPANDANSRLACELSLYKLGGGEKIRLSYQKKKGNSFKQTFTLFPGQKIGPFPVRYANLEKWSIHEGNAAPERKSQYLVALSVETELPQEGKSFVLQATSSCRLRFLSP